MRDRADAAALCLEFRRIVAPPLGGVRLIRRIRWEGGYLAVLVDLAPYLRLCIASAQEPFDIERPDVVISVFPDRSFYVD
ncbi:MAG: hypothetical protein OEX97_11535, partial [Acidimicrobiia bacterium]|nr:hypothetical protein [Acidimicrobiia bacterium]